MCVSTGVWCKSEQVTASTPCSWRRPVWWGLCFSGVHVCHGTGILCGFNVRAA